MKNTKTKEEWAKLIADFKSSGLTQAEFCRANGVNPKTFYAWLTKSKSAKKQGKSKSTQPDSTPKPTANKPVKTSAPEDESHGTLNVVLPNGTELYYMCSSKKALQEALEAIASLKITRG